MLSRLSETQKIVLVCVVGLSLCALVILAAVALGSESIPLGTTLRILGERMGLDVDESWSPDQQAIVMQVRLPRVLVAAMVGAALAFSGALLQGLFRNPLASPSLLGVGGGGALGAVICIATGLAARSLWPLPLCAFAGALLTIFTVYALATTHGETPLATLLLAGIAVTAFVGAATSLVIVISAQHSWDIGRQILFWTMGGLDARRWEHVTIAAIPIGAAVVGAVFFLRELNIMLLGEEQARTLGVDTRRLKIWILLLTSLATGAAVAVSGLIGFVGLLVPHLLRLILGPDHRRLIPATVFAGAVFLVVMDTLARWIAPTEMRLGIITGALGAPFFVVLLIRHRKKAIHL